MDLNLSPPTTPKQFIELGAIRRDVLPAAMKDSRQQAPPPNSNNNTATLSNPLASTERTVDYLCPKQPPSDQQNIPHRPGATSPPAPPTTTVTHRSSPAADHQSTPPPAAPRNITVDRSPPPSSVGATSHLINFVVKQQQQHLHHFETATDAPPADNDNNQHSAELDRCPPTPMEQQMPTSSTSGGASLQSSMHPSAAPLGGVPAASAPMTSSSTLPNGVTSSIKMEMTSAAPNTAAFEYQCAACRQRIYDKYLLKAIDKFWHEDCLKCACCQCRLGELDSTLFFKQGMVLCRKDYLRMFGATGQCAACQQTIPAFEMVMRARQNVYHLECFACQECQHRFCVGDKFYLCDNKILCEYDYEERMVFSQLAYNYTSLAQLKRHIQQVDDLDEVNTATVPTR